MITRRIFEWAERTPGRIAVVYNGKSWTYRSLANAIAVARGYFVRHGYTGPGCAVLAVRNLMDFWVLSLALRSLGLTTLNIGVAKLLDKLGLPDVRCVVTSPFESWPKLAGRCEALGLTLVSASLEGEAPLDLDAPGQGHEPGGHVLLTSGTTGAFKMVLMSPAVDSVFLKRNADLLGLGQDSILSVFNFPAWTGLGYRMAACPWLAGGATLIDQRGEAHSTLLYPGISHATLTPTMLDQIFAAPKDAFPRNDALQLVVTAGAMTKRQCDEAKARISRHVVNLLSSTEGNCIAITPLETEADRRWQRMVPGRTVEIVDDKDRPVPVGTEGRIRISTAGGPDCYLHNAAATRTFFRNGYFYPGDIAVMRADGRIALQGRLTDVINVRGDKIVPGPIEDRMTDRLGVRGVCLFSMPDESGEEEIYVVLETAGPVDPKRLAEVLRDEMSGFARARVHCVAALSRNQMGKVVRQTVREETLAAQPPVTTNI